MSLQIAWRAVLFKKQNKTKTSREEQNDIKWSNTSQDEHGLSFFFF